MSLRFVLASALIGGLATFGSASARAEAGEPSAAAEALFQEGRRLLMAGKAAEACPKLEESQRLDPATGTLVALALCREQQGKLASAWAAFVDAEGRARLEHRADREALAHEHAVALRPRLSTLTLRTAPELANEPDLALSLDGVSLGRGAWNVEIPTDGGTHAIEARVHGRTAWRTSIALKSEGEHARVDVRRSDVAPRQGANVATVPTGSTSPLPGSSSALPGSSPAAAVSPPAPPPTATPSSASPATWSTPRVVAVTVAAAGVLAVGAGIYVAVGAKHDYDRAVAGCPALMCKEDAPNYGQITDARHRGNVATVVSLVGGAAILAGAALWIVAPSEAPSADSPKKVASWWIEPLAANVHGAAVVGRF